MKPWIDHSLSKNCGVDQILLRMARTGRAHVEDIDRIIEHISILRKRVGPPNDQYSTRSRLEGLDELR